MPTVIGLDLGTTNCKAVALTREGMVVGVAGSKVGLLTPRPGWVEQSAPEVLGGALAALRGLAEGMPAGDVAGLCLSGAMHSLLLVDAAGEPLAPALTWADQRAASQAAALQAEAGQELYQRTGCPAQALYHPAKLRWWLAEAPELARRAARFVSLKDWVMFKLGAGWATDVGLASTNGLLDIRRLEWDEQALALAGVSAERLPPLVAPFERLGRLSAWAAGETGSPAGLPIVAGSSDGGLAMFGSGAGAVNDCVITVGTSGAVRRLVDEPWLDPGRRTWCYVLQKGRWFAGGAINNGGLALQWVRERFYPQYGIDEGYRRLLAEAAGIAPGAEGVWLLPYFSGERSPHWTTEARAVLGGLRLEHDRRHVARAALESVAYCLADVWQVLETDRGATDRRPGTLRLTGSIARTPVWAQILADLLGLPLQAVEAADASAIGAAMVGQRALGHIERLDDLAARLPAGHIYQPDPARHAFYRTAHQEFQARVGEALYPQMSQIKTGKN